MYPGITVSLKDRGNSPMDPGIAKSPRDRGRGNSLRVKGIA